VSDVPELEQVLVAIGGHVATVTLNRPEQRNPLSSTMLRDLATAFRWCQHEPEVRVIVLTGAGDRVFCAGADLTGFDGGMSDLERHRSRELFVDLFTLMSSLGKPIVGNHRIQTLHGPAFRGTRMLPQNPANLRAAATTRQCDAWQREIPTIRQPQMPAEQLKICQLWLTKRKTMYG